MNHCIRLFLLLVPSLITLGLLGTAFVTKWWIVPLEKVIYYLEFNSNIHFFIFVIYRIFLKKIH